MTRQSRRRPERLYLLADLTRWSSGPDSAGGRQGYLRSGRFGKVAFGASQRAHASAVQATHVRERGREPGGGEELCEKGIGAEEVQRNAGRIRPIGPANTAAYFRMRSQVRSNLYQGSG
jgi:hypothetical protein